MHASNTIPGHIIDPVRGVIAALFSSRGEDLEVEELGPAYTVEQAERWARDVWQARRAAPVMRKAS